MNKNMCALRHGYNQTLSSLPSANPLPLSSKGEASGALLFANAKQRGAVAIYCD